MIIVYQSQGTDVLIREKDLERIAAGSTDGVDVQCWFRSRTREEEPRPAPTALAGIFRFNRWTATDAMQQAVKAAS